MSLSTWKEEFYYCPPQQKMTALQAADHSLLKWEGLLPKNIKKHKLLNNGELEMFCNEEKAYFAFDSDNCSLCVKYMRKDSRVNLESRCTECPLVKAGEGSCLDKGGPFALAFDKNKIDPMIKALRNTVVWILENDIE